MKVCVLTSVHEPFDPRIFYKQAKSLAKAGYEVVLIAPHSRDEVVDSIKIRALPPRRGRIKRILGTWKVLRWALEERADIYHFHDPELLLVGWLLKVVTGRPVIYDCHEYYPEAIMSRKWIPRVIRPVLGGLLRPVEAFFASSMSTVVVTEGQKARFPKAIVLYNFPLLSSYRTLQPAPPGSEALIYIGALSEERGVLLMIEALEALTSEGAKLTLVGRFDSPHTQAKVEALVRARGLEQRVEIVGQVPHDAVGGYLREAAVGLVPLQPKSQYAQAVPTKMFEYMASGLPIVASDLPPTRRFMEGVGCGFLVTPTDPKAHAEAIDYLLGHPEEARQMGERGRRAFLEGYNWEKAEEGKLLQLYAGLAARSGCKSWRK